jgi:hypothetical protein
MAAMSLRSTRLSNVLAVSSVGYAELRGGLVEDGRHRPGTAPFGACLQRYRLTAAPTCHSFGCLSKKPSWASDKSRYRLTPVKWARQSAR